MPDISSAKGAAEDMVALMDSKPQIDSESPALPSVRLTSSPSDIEKAQSKAQIGMEDADSRIDTAGRVELRDVHFRYRECQRMSTSLSLRQSHLCFFSWISCDVRILNLICSHSAGRSCPSWNQYGH